VLCALCGKKMLGLCVFAVQKGDVIQKEEARSQATMPGFVRFVPFVAKQVRYSHL
jgi:hypothetical protein